MADWVEEVAKLLWRLTAENPEFAKQIRLAIRRIEQRPQIGRYMRETRYTYTDPQQRFRISYNYHPQAEEIEIVVLNIFQDEELS